MNYLKHISILLILIINHFFQITESIAQPQTEWIQRYNSSWNYDDYIWDMAIDKSGNVYLTGYISINDTNQDFVTIKYNTQGIEQWVRYYDGPDHREDKAGSIEVDDSGNVFVTGYSYSYSEFDDIVTIKYNTTGDSIWTRKFIGIGHVSDRPNAMDVDNYGNVYITGSGITCSFCPQDILTIKYSSYGNLDWVRYYNDSANVYDVGYDIISDNFNNIFVSGVNFVEGVILNYDFLGNQNLFFSDPNIWGYKILIDKNRNIILGFDSYGGLSTRTDIAAAKIDSMAKLSWLRTYHNSSTNNNDYFRDMCLDRSGNVIVTGVSANLGHLGWDIATIKYSSTGDTLWIIRYDPISTLNSNDEPSGIASDKFGNIYVTGSSDSGLFAKMITIKYSPTGQQEWIEYYNNGNPFAWHSGVKIFVDTLGNMYVVGRSLGNGTGIDIVTIKYSIITNYQNSSNFIPKEFKLFQNYPNPFNLRTIINYELPVPSNVSLKIFNALGKEIKTLVNELQNAGSYKIEFDGSDFSSGIYFYNFSANGIFISSKKLILLK